MTAIDLHMNFIVDNNVRATKENLSDRSVRVTIYAQEGGGPLTKVAQVLDRGQLGNGTPFAGRQGDKGPIDQLRVDNWTEPEHTKTKYACVLADIQGLVP